MTQNKTRQSSDRYWIPGIDGRFFYLAADVEALLTSHAALVEALRAQVAEVILRRQETLAMCDQLTSELATVTAERDQAQAMLARQKPFPEAALTHKEQSR